MKISSFQTLSGRKKTITILAFPFKANKWLEGITKGVGRQGHWVGYMMRVMISMMINKISTNIYHKNAFALHKTKRLSTMWQGHCHNLLSHLVIAHKLDSASRQIVFI